MAYKNLSSDASSIRKMMTSFNSDLWDIDRVLYYCEYRKSAIVQSDILLNKYRNYFDQYIETIKLDSKYYYCPQRFAEDFYGDAGLDFLVLYFANMTSLFEFNTPTIKVLRYDKLKDFNKLVTKYKTDIDNSKKNPTDYS